MQTEQSVREILKQAVEFTKEVPDRLQGVAFQRVFDLLTEMHCGRAHGMTRERSQIGSRVYSPRVMSNRESARRTRSELSPRRVIARSIADGFFDLRRTQEALSRHLKDNYATTIDDRMLATALARAVRRGELRRRQSEQGVYEYERVLPQGVDIRLETSDDDDGQR